MVSTIYFGTIKNKENFQSWLLDQKWYHENMDQFVIVHSVAAGNNTEERMTEICWNDLKSTEIEPLVSRRVYSKKYYSPFFNLK